MPLNYEIRVRGRVGEHLADALGMAAEVEPVETVLRGPVNTQDGLHEFLAQLSHSGSLGPARVEDGVLTLTLPKSKESLPRRIAVN